MKKATPATDLFPIFVPSKGRAKISKLLPLLAEQGIKANVVVEPAEEKAYRLAQPDHKLVVLAGNGRGLPFSRSSVMALGRAQGLEWLWMIDDDVSGFFRARDGKNAPTSAREALLEAQALITEDVGQVALEYQQFSWAAKKPAKRNGYCDVVVANRVSLGQSHGVAYDPSLELKGDRDYTVQVIASGYDAVRACQVGFAAPKNGSNDGGLAPVYATSGRERAMVDAFSRKWPWCISPQTKPDGRYDAKIRWSEIRLRPAG